MVVYGSGGLLNTFYSVTFLPIPHSLVSTFFAGGLRGNQQDTLKALAGIFRFLEKKNNTNSLGINNQVRNSMWADLSIKTHCA